MAIINLSAPWIKFYREIEAMFKYDPEVNVIFDAEQMNVKVFVDAQTKAEALSLLLVKSKKFGDTEVTVSVVPANVNQPQKGFTYKRRGRYISADNAASVYRMAFEGNPVFRYEASTGGDLVFNAHYVVFRSEVVQFFNDDLSDLNGICSTLYQEIAKDIFDKPADAVGTYYCTEYNHYTQEDSMANGI